MVILFRLSAFIHQYIASIYVYLSGFIWGMWVSVHVTFVYISSIKWSDSYFCVQKYEIEYLFCLLS